MKTLLQVLNHCMLVKLIRGVYSLLAASKEEVGQQGRNQHPNVYVVILMFARQMMCPLTDSA